MYKKPKYNLTLCFIDNESKDMFADNVLFFDKTVHILRGDDCVMIVPIDKIKFLLSKKFKE